MTVQNTQTETVRTEAAPQQGGNTNPGYYKNRAFECVGFAQYLNFNLGNAFKYIWRHKEKGGREDLEKALRYLERQRADAPKFKKLKHRRYEKMYAGLKDCGFDGGTEAALLAVISAAYYIRDGEDNFAWAAACVEDLLEKMPPEAGRARTLKARCRLKRRAEAFDPPTRPPPFPRKRESGIPDFQIIFEYCCCSKVRIPACAGMTEAAGIRPRPIKPTERK